MKSQPNALMNAFIWMFYVILDMTVYVMKMTTNKSKREIWRLKPCFANFNKMLESEKKSG